MLEIFFIKMKRGILHRYVEVEKRYGWKKQAAFSRKITYSYIAYYLLLTGKEIGGGKWSRPK